MKYDTNFRALFDTSFAKSQTKKSFISDPQKANKSPLIYANSISTIHMKEDSSWNYATPAQTQKNLLKASNPQPNVAHMWSIKRKLYCFRM